MAVGERIQHADRIDRILIRGGSVRAHLRIKDIARAAEVMKI